MKFFRNRPDTPQNRFAESADRMIVFAFGAGFGAGTVAFGLDLLVGLLTGSVETPTWSDSIVPMATGLAAAFACGMVINVYRKRLKSFAPPVEEPTDAIDNSRIPQAHAAESPDDAVLQYAARLQRHLRWKIGVLAACSACSGFCLIAAGLATPTMVSALVAGEEVPQLLWVIYGFLWGAGWVFAFMAYLQARNFVRHVSALVRLNLDRQLKNRRDRPLLTGYLNVMSREP